MLSTSSEAVNDWLRQQKAAGGDAASLPWEDGVEASSDETISTVAGEEAVLQAIGKESESDPSTAEDENKVIDLLNESSSKQTSTVSGEENLIMNLQQSSTPVAPPGDPLKSVLLLSSLTRSIFQRCNQMVICFLDGLSVYKADYQEYLTTKHKQMFRFLEQLPVEFRVSLPNPPSVPPPDVFSTSQHVQEYNSESLKVCISIFDFPSLLLAS
eukprot:TRINITY_DN5049_c0_g1_i2.p1 TRINITY_DN5049_c0_g1~~TRINITY_DN5049_c0_g1_i2.p1  ORF type:complete len:213 (+),score=49.12 TRINITY_DN5049_c0_g1_i2:117-755(+)